MSPSPTPACNSYFLVFCLVSQQGKRSGHGDPVALASSVSPNPSRQLWATVFAEPVD